MELVVATADEAAYAYMASALSAEVASGGLAGLAKLTLMLFGTDARNETPSEFAMWAAIIKRPTCGAILTTWDVNHRKRPDSLRQEAPRSADRPRHTLAHLH